MAEKIDVIIIGGGQAGLAASHHLSLKSIDHLVLEAGAGPASFWQNLWDSFTLVTTNFMLNLPGAEYQGSEPEGHLSRAEVVAYLTRYAAGKPVQYNSRVSGVRAAPGGDSYAVQTSQGDLEAHQVIVATGAYQKVKIPPYAADLPAGFLQISTGEYRRPQALPDGAVLIAGSGQSGAQIAEELNQAGRQVYLAVGSAGRVPRWYRGRDITWWLLQTGFFDTTVDMLPSPQARFTPNPMLSGKDGGHELNLHQFARDGITLLGHIRGVDGCRLILAPDLHESLRRTDEFEREKLEAIDRWIALHAPDTAPVEDRPVHRDGYQVPMLEALDLRESGVRTVIWACGYSNRYDFIDFPVFDDSGWPVHTRGVTAVDGLYFTGLPYLSKRKSSILLGSGEDGEYLSAQAALAARRSAARRITQPVQAPGKASTGQS